MNRYNYKLKKQQWIQKQIMDAFGFHYEKVRDIVSEYGWILMKPLPREHKKEVPLPHPDNIRPDLLGFRNEDTEVEFGEFWSFTWRWRPIQLKEIEHKQFKDENSKTNNRGPRRANRSRQKPVKIGTM